jgi:ubiquitin-conjugating enzyme E2 Q
VEHQAEKVAEYIHYGCLCVFNVWLLRVDPDSQLFKDLKQLQQKEDKDYIELSMTFKETFPFTPPFVRVIYPVISGG